MRAATIDDVLSRLDREIARARAAGARWGYFPALYRAVTAEVKRAIEDGEFEDGSRMERLDVVFAQRYFDALDQRRAGQRPSRSWELALRATERDDLLVMQHLLLGMNAHINLDLALAAAEVAPGAAIGALRADFLHINEILARMVDGAEAALARVFPALGALDRLAGQADERAAALALREARGAAWAAATRLATEVDADRRAQAVRVLDAKTSLLGQVVGAPAPGGAAAVRLLEPDTASVLGVRRAIDALGAARRLPVEGGRWDARWEPKLAAL